MTDEELITHYITIRDRKKEMKAKHQLELEPLNNALDLLEDKMLAILNERGAQNTKTPAGTAFKKTQSKCKMVDRDAFLNYVQDHGAWDLITNHVSSEAVQSIIEVAKKPPDGVAVEQEIVVQFRRS